MVTIVLLATLSRASEATVPLFDRLEVEGQSAMLRDVKGGWLPLPRSERLQELVRAERCSAIGGPRGKYRISDGKLWLVGLFRCGGNITLESVYGGTGEPMLAEWISGDLVSDRGKPLCIRRGFFAPPIYERRMMFRVDRGVVTDLRQESNADHPDVPKEAADRGIPACVRP
jgi:hypothetical protein